MMPKRYHPVSLNDLPRYSQWPARLLGLSTWERPNRTRGKVTSEYERDKYARCLEFADAAKVVPDVEEVRRYEFSEENQDVCAAWGDELGAAALMDAYEDYYALIANTVLPLLENGTTVIELGCGYGYNLSMLKRRTNVKCSYIGGDYAQTAVELAGKIFSDEKDVRVGHFDFYDTSYKLLETLEGPLVVFTAHAIEQLPDVRNLFPALSAHREKIRAVVHCEPVYEYYGDNLLGLLRKRYIEANDYNRNLVSELRSRAREIEIVKEQKNMFGFNALNPTSVIEWRFTR